MWNFDNVAKQDLTPTAVTPTADDRACLGPVEISKTTALGSIDRVRASPDSIGRAGIALNEPFAAHVQKGGWRSLIREMQRKPGAAIPERDAKKIGLFLEYFSERRRNPTED